MSALPLDSPRPAFRVLRRDDAVSETPGNYDAGERRSKPCDAGRFVMLPYALMSAGLSPQAVFTFAWLRRHDGDEGCFPGYGGLATEMRCSLRSAKAYVAELEACGFLTHRRRGRGNTNKYTLYPEGDGPRRAPVHPADDVQDSAPYMDDVQPIARPEVQDSAPVEVQNPARKLHGHELDPLGTRADPTDQPSTREARPVESNPAGPKPAPQPRQPRQPTLDAPKPSEEVAAVLAALGVTATGDAIKTFTAIVDGYPDLNHRLLAALCADGCQRKRIPRTPQVYAAWCERETTKRQTNGVGHAGGHATAPGSAPSRPGLGQGGGRGGAVDRGVEGAVQGPPAADEWTERARRKLRQLEAQRAADVPGVRVGDQTGDARLAPDGGMGA